MNFISKTKLSVFFCLILFCEGNTARWDEEFVQSEREGHLTPHHSYITNVEFWEECPEDSWYIAQNYLNFAEREGAEGLSLGVESIFRCIGSSYLRLNYRLIDSADAELQAQAVREFEPFVADIFDGMALSMDFLWLPGLPEVYPNEVEPGCMCIKNTEIAQPRFLTMLPSSFTGKRLCVGGKGGVSADDFILNIDRTENPDVIADGVNAYHLMPFPDGKFEEVYFDHIGHTVLTEEEPYGKTLSQYHRMLTPEGTFRFLTEHASKSYYAKLLGNLVLCRIRAQLESKGFHVQECKLKRDKEPEWEHAPYYIDVFAKKMG